MLILWKQLLLCLHSNLPALLVKTQIFWCCHFIIYSQPMQWTVQLFWQGKIPCLRHQTSETASERIYVRWSFISPCLYRLLFYIQNMWNWEKISFPNGHQDKKIGECTNVFRLPWQNQEVIETNGCRAMVILYNGNQHHSLTSVRYGIFCKKGSRAKNFVSPERLPPTPSACRFHYLQTYYQVMQRMWNAVNMEPTEWGWKEEYNNLIPIMTEKSPAPDTLLRMVHCCSTIECDTLWCSCRKYGMGCTNVCVCCQGNCSNQSTMAESYVEEEEH